MSPNVLWFLPTHGDGRYLGTSQGRPRTVDVDYLRQIAQAADTLGYYGVLLPTGRCCEDSWVVASSPDRRDRAAQLPGRGPARPAVAQPGRAHDRDPRPAVQRAPADQRRHRRRPGRERGRRRLRRPCRALRGDATNSSASGAPRWPARAASRLRFRGKHMRVEGRQAAVSAGAEAASAALFRRLVRAGPRLAAEQSTTT